MKKVFIGGSRHITSLNAQIRNRLDNIIEKKLSLLIGDANGADKAVQQFFHEKNYRGVEIFCSGNVCRNNVDRWSVRHVPVDTHVRDAQFYSAKDRVMAQEADCGLMLWDGKSAGTLLNVFRLLDLKKKVVVYVAPDKAFHEFRNKAEWEALIAECDMGLRHKIEKRTTLEFAPNLVPVQSSFFSS